MAIDTLIAKAKVFKGQTQGLILKFKRRINWFDIGKNLDTSDCVDRQFLFDDNESPNVKYMGRYVPTHFMQLKESLGWLIAHDKTVLDHTVIDFGCGKGRVLIMAERMGFKKIIGIEYSKKMYDICLQNLKKVKASRVKVVCGDATEYQPAEDVKTFYFCNPFEYVLFEKVLANIKKMLRSTGKTGYIVYIDPRKFGRLDPKEYELLHDFNVAGTTPFHIYKVRT